jgi:hypothetical protein
MKYLGSLTVQRFSNFLGGEKIDFIDNDEIFFVKTSHH